MSHPDISRDFIPRLVIRDKADALVLLEALAIRSRYVDETPAVASLRSAVRSFATELPAEPGDADLPGLAPVGETLAEMWARWGREGFKENDA